MNTEQQQQLELRPLSPEEAIQRLKHILQLLESIEGHDAPLPKVRVMLRGVIGCGIAASIVKGQEATPPCRDYNCMATIADQALWCATCAAHAEYLRGRSDAATSMRSLCVEKVKSMRDENRRNYEYWKSISSSPDTDGVLKWSAWAGEDERIIKELESLSIQEQEGKQPS